MKARYYAITAADGSGPALGVGCTKDEAWRDAERWAGMVDRHGQGWVCREITDDSFQRVMAGNPDAWEARK